MRGSRNLQFAVAALLAAFLMPLTTFGRWISVDPHAAKYPSITPYAYALNNPVRYVDPVGLEAWEVTGNWTEEAQKQYQEYATNAAERYRKDGTKTTCEDLALNVLVDFASEKGLPLSITNGSGTYEVSSDKFNSVSDFRNAVLTTTAASDLQRSDNTVSVGLGSLSAGDLILHTGGNGVATHTQLVTSKTETSIGIHQGSFNLWGNIPLVGSPDPRSSRYVGGGVQTGSYTLDSKSGTYTYTRGSSSTSNAFSAFGVQLKRWNFGIIGKAK